LFCNGNAGNNKDTGVTVLQPTNLTDDACFVNTQLDFYMENQNEAGEWVGIKNGLPALKIFAKSDVLDMTKGIYVDTSWYNTEPYEISTISQLYGLAKLSKTVDFTGKTITLTESLVLNENEGNAETWGENVPKYLWTPIQSFTGTFDGDMNTISGIYVKSNKSNIGLFKQVTGTVKNLILENSYIENTSTSGNTTGTGSIVGNLQGTVDTVKSSADVVLKGSSYAGGLVGDIAGTQQGTMSNCWFAGTVSGTGQHHGTLLGGVHYGSTKGYVKHCLSTGTIDLENNTGGLVGSMWDTAELTISDTLFAGKFDEETAAIVEGKTHGAVVGNARNGYVTVENVYVQKGSGIADNKILGSVSTTVKENGVDVEWPIGVHNQPQKANVTYLESKQLYLDDARENTELKIYPQGQDSSFDGDSKEYWWYVSETHPLLASFATPVSYSKLKVATYNIKSCINLEKSNHASVRADIVKYIDDEEIDVCMLQEVDEFCSRTGFEKQAEKIAEELTKATGVQYYSTYVETLSNQLNSFNDFIVSFGMAIVSRYPMTNVESKIIEFPGTDQQNRALLKAMINVDGTETALIATHFDDSPAAETECRQQCVAALKTMVEGIDPSTPIIFGGDLNQAYSRTNKDDTAIIKDIGKFLTSVTKSRTDVLTHFNGQNWYQLDYVFTNDYVQCGYATVDTPTSATITDENGEKRELSDHRPLVVNLYMNIQ